MTETRGLFETIAWKALAILLPTMVFTFANGPTSWLGLFSHRPQPATQNFETTDALEFLYYMIIVWKMLGRNEIQEVRSLGRSLWVTMTLDIL